MLRRLGTYRNLNLHNIILDSVCHRIVDALFIGKAGQAKPLLPGVGEDILIALWKPAPGSLMKGSQIDSFGLHMQPFFSWKKGNFNKKLCIILEISFL